MYVYTYNIYIYTHILTGMTIAHAQRNNNNCHNLIKNIPYCRTESACGHQLKSAVQYPSVYSTTMSDNTLSYCSIQGVYSVQQPNYNSLPFPWPSCMSFWEKDLHWSAYVDITVAECPSRCPQWEPLSLQNPQMTFLGPTARVQLITINYNMSTSPINVGSCSHALPDRHEQNIFDWKYKIDKISTFSHIVASQFDIAHFFQMPGWDAWIHISTLLPS